jgi:hypothetical protein
MIDLSEIKKMTDSLAENLKVLKSESEKINNDLKSQLEPSQRDILNLAQKELNGVVNSDLSIEDKLKNIEKWKTKILNLEI